ncbi:HAMP domain-containing protein [Salinispora arenicola]|uniref:Circadian input-output histidine kinase CikA n=2 Tax=Salinispora arenicola TaxID=168697 RepID=A0A542XLN9_SALAC|nr:HAMP domain-containing protein [Salinispora arenicola]TQL36767.1 signal transduction histidine kinase [Salinispora arenicola]
MTTAKPPVAELSAPDPEAVLIELTEALRRVRRGDLKVRLPRRPGRAGEVADAFNDVVSLQERQHHDLRRISRIVGQDGRLNERLDGEGLDGSWAEGQRAVNSLIDDLGRPTIEIARVIVAVAEGDLSQHMALKLDDRPLRGEYLGIGRRVNTMVDQLSSFADEVTRVAREVGTEGKLGGQADVRGAAGTWKDLIDSVNTMGSNLTAQVRNISQVSTAVATGDLGQKITVDAQGEILELKNTVNTMVDQLSSFADEVTRVAREVGTEGKLGGQAQVKGVSGTWRDLTENVNQLAGNLTSQVRNISQVSTAVATGDLGQKITVDAQGEILELKNTVNTMVDQLSSFADEVTRVAREVGTEGKLGGQAQVKGVSGTWRDLTDNVNSMASNLTSQVRNIASVTTAVARGDLGQKITVDAQGEILELKNTVNTMVDQLSSFADEVTRVAREVGTEGKLGGQAQVRGVAGTWRDLTENVNQLASTLTVQLRTIAQVSTSVTRGDLTQRIAVEAQGEVAELTDNINQMIVTLRETTEENAEQGWLDSNLARIGGLLQGQRDLGEVCRMIMTEVTPLVDAQLGAFFLVDDSEGSFRLRLAASYGYVARGQDVTFGPGEGLVGQTALSRRTIRVSGGPDNPLRLRSGLADTAPADLVVLPVIFEGELLGVIEFASMTALSDLYLSFLERLVLTIGVAVNTIQANRRTEELLSQSQRLAHELQEQSAELQRTNAELEEKAKLLSEQKGNIETKNREVELARLGLEETAQQLTRASAYKSEFLANMSHELRTPLNSLLLLARLLVENPEQNLSPKQIEFARTIHSAGTDLLSLIDDILDLSKIEAGRMDVEPTGIRFTEIRSYVEQAFVPQAQEKGLDFEVRVSPDLPEKIVTDAQRLQQILRNLISNAVKFTDAGVVRLAIAPAPESAVFDVPALTNARQVIAFTVADTGIGISDDKLSIIFEAFQQADGTTSRRYGGTGLGLSISRDLARLLGGAIGVSSAPGQGSTFTLFVPDVLAPDAVVGPAPPSPARAGLPSSLLMPSVELLPTAAEAAATRQLAGATVLIVDDDVRTVFALTSALELHGMTVLYADNGADGVRLLAEHPEADIVLMDAMIPDQDGYETTRQIRRNHRFADLPIVFLTAKAMPGDRESALAAGGSDYITKPVDLDELIELMTTWISGGRSEEGL